MSSSKKNDSILPFGAYETPVTARVQERMQITKRESPTTIFATAPGDDESTKDRYIQSLTQLVGKRLDAALRRTKSSEDRIMLINQVIGLLDVEDTIEDESLLYAVHSTGLADPPPLPEIPLSGAALLTNAAKDQNMSAELRREFRTADSVDLICAFIKSSGIRVIHDELMELKDRGVPLRVITTTYCGATEAAAVDRLVKVYGAEVKINYDPKTTRLHAKAWLLRRNSGFDTAYIGSSNLSNSALVDGIEWNVRTSVATTPTIVDKFIATFDTYWNDSHFEAYDPARDQELLTDALSRASGTSSNLIELSGLDVRPYPYQADMLEALQAEREEHNRHKNLIVAATGTGKTVVAALDYRNLCDATGRRPRLLFIAHRREILEQARKTYREVLKEPSFGELLATGSTPKNWNHVFAMVQSLNAARLDQIAADHFEVLTIDEFHHAEAPSYRRVMNHFEPKELLGLTATPERGDGENIQKFFDYRVAYELRLWDALKLQLLSPMHYFGINDETDLTTVEWSRKSRDYDITALGDFYVKAGQKRIELILRELNKRLFDLNTMKALGFCVNIAHAHYMAKQFNDYGLPAIAIDHHMSPQQRANAILKLKAGEVKILFAVDIFNEGVDIPSVNTLLLLRPTQSPTVFLQQLGRGLRLFPGKDVCTVMDFIGQQHENYDFEARYFALTGKRGQSLVDHLDHGFPNLPPGTNIILDEVSQDQVLANVKRATRNSLKTIHNRMTDETTTNLAEFIDNTGIPLSEIYRRDKVGWTTLLIDTGLVRRHDPSADELYFLNRLRGLLHVNDDHRSRAYKELLDSNGPFEADMDDTMRAYARMIITVMWANQTARPTPNSIDDGLAQLRSFSSLRKELGEILTVTLSESRRLPAQMPKAIGFGALYTHADYSLAEIMAALQDKPLAEVVKLPREGVKHLEELNLDIFFVTLVKNEKTFSPTTSYHDYAISPSKFHWESQSSASLKSKAARRYIHHQELGGTIIMAVRNTKENEVGLAGAYTLLGELDYVRHQSEKPIQFEWDLKRPMPNKVYAEGRAVV